MKMKCNVARDLIPLYIEGLTNEESSELVKQHISECTECRNYYEMIRRDYEQPAKSVPDKNQLNTLVEKLASYQRNIKLVGVLVAMLLSCIISGAGVQLLSTIPFLILTPYVSRLYYNRSAPIVLSTIPFGILGGMLSEENASFIPFFTVIALLTACVGVVAAVLTKFALNQYKLGLKLINMIMPAAVLFVSCAFYFSLSGNPIGYIDTMIRTKNYVKQTYEEGTLSFKGVHYNFKDNLHHGKFEYILNGTRQVASIAFYRNGEVNDYYKYVLEMQFVEERSADLKTEIAAAINYSPVAILATPEEELNITRDEINQTYYHLSYDIERRNKATQLRKSESDKISYEVSFGAFMGEYDVLSKEQFLSKSIAVLNTLQDRSVLFRHIELKALDANGQLQSVSLNKNTTEQQLIDSYQIKNIDSIKN